MILYHGTTLRIEQPRIIRTEIGRDFGFAFYTTDIKEQAERWAIRRAKIESRKKKAACNANQIAFCTERALETLSFVDSFVVAR